MGSTDTSAHGATSARPSSRGETPGKHRQDAPEKRPAKEAPFTDPKTIATEQAPEKKERAGKGGIVPPKDRRFGQPNGNPRNPGGWVKKDTPRYKLEEMLKMTDEELKAVGADTRRPRAERKFAEIIYNGNWKELRQIIHEVYGRPRQLAPEGTIQKPKEQLEIEEKLKTRRKQ